MRCIPTFGAGVLAGCLGGLAEVGWVGIYAGFVDFDPAVMARGITTAAGVEALLPASPVQLGLVVHMTLAALLGVALTFAWYGLCILRRRQFNPRLFMLASLTCVWIVNFFVVLPVISPAFVHLVPYPVSLVSKLLFGAVLGEIVRDEQVIALESAEMSTSPALRERRHLHLWPFHR